MGPHIRQIGANWPTMCRVQSTQPPPTAPLNQTPPLVDYNLFTTDEALRAAVDREGAGAQARQLARDGATTRHRRQFRACAARQSPSAGAQQLQRAGRAYRRGRVSSLVARLDGGHHGTRLPQRPVGTRCRPRGARGARRGLFDAGSNRVRHAVSNHDDLRRDRRDQPRPRSGGRVAAAAHHAALRSPRHPHRLEVRRPDRHGHDRETRRVGCARQYHARGADGRRVVPAQRSQMVLLSAAVRRASRARADRRRTVVLLHAAPAARRIAERHLHTAIEGQARQPVQRILGGGVPGCVGFLAG